MPFGLQPIHIIVVAIVALLIFGPAKLPELGRALGRGINEFKRGAKDIVPEFTNALNDTTPIPTNPITPSSNGSIQPLAFESMNATSQDGQSEPSIGSFCVSCGAKNPLEARFCNKCGTALPALPLN